uniref:Zyxin n=1 Tax=Schistocephalus solidus TaxID=70667 RepID=A0A0X3NXX8_SCHSO
MSRFPYLSPHASLSSSFNERAGPRITDTGDRRYHHRVVPLAQRSGAPHYAQSSELYPMEARSDSYNPHRYRPSESLDSGPASLGSPQFGQTVMIPVVHLGSNREASSTPTSSLDSSSLVRSVGSPTPSTGSLPRPAPARKMQATDPEAEVDALTNVLMRSLETRPSAGTSSLISHEARTSSPVSSIHRGPGIQSPVGSAPGAIPGSRVNRLQQQQTSSSPVNGAGVGQGSPITIGPGSPRTSSPTSSASSTVGTGGDPFLLNNCFRCRRPLVPPEGSTLGPQSQSSSSIVTLTGALAVRLHSTCFTCYLCRTPLAPNAYYHSVHRLLCPTCVRDGAVESCANCKRPIGERIVRALGQPYHPNCFVCVVCNCRLDSKPFTVDVHERPLCLEDFHRRYAPRCAHCKRLIVPESGSREARRVVAGPSDYHLNCYRLSLAAGAGSSQPQQPTNSLASALAMS